MEQNKTKIIIQYILISATTCPLSFWTQGAWLAVAANLFEGDVLAGLVPTLFADDPNSAERAITSDAAKAHRDINKINKVFMVPENIGLKDAVSLLKKPR